MNGNKYNDTEILPILFSVVVVMPGLDPYSRLFCYLGRSAEEGF